MQDRRCKAPLDRRFQAEKSLVVTRSDRTNVLFFMQLSAVILSSARASNPPLLGRRGERGGENIIYIDTFDPLATFVSGSRHCYEDCADRTLHIEAAALNSSKQVSCICSIPKNSEE